jgi:hypothetical protein
VQASTTSQVRIRDEVGRTGPEGKAEENWQTTIKPYAGIDGRRITSENVLQMLQRAYSDLWRTGGGGGTVWHHGAGAPTTDTVPGANPGDYYLNIANGDVYKLDGSGAFALAEAPQAEGVYDITSFTPQTHEPSQQNVLSLV